MEQMPEIDSLLRGSDSLFDRSFDVVAVKHADGAAFGKDRPPARFRAFLNQGWVNGAPGTNRLIGGYVMSVCIRAGLAFSNL